MRYPCGVGHMGAVRVCWHEGSRNGYYICLCVLLQETNHVKRVIKSLIVGTTSLYIGRVRIVPPVVPVCLVIGNCLGEERIEHACIISSLVGLITLLVTLFY